MLGRPPVNCLNVFSKEVSGQSHGKSVKLCLQITAMFTERNAEVNRYQHTMSSNAKFREMGPFSLKIVIKTLGTTFDLIKNASESFWKFGLLTLRPLGLWPLRPS